MAEYEADSIPSSRKRHRPSAFDDTNEAMYKWYSLARQRNVPVSGPMLQEEARLMAQKLDHAEGFKASNCEQEDSLMLVEDLELEEVADTEEDTYLQQFVSQFDPNTTVNEYVNADEELDTCLTFEDTDEWREELCSMVCDEFESNASPLFQDDESEDAADEPECDPEKSSITSFNNAVTLSHDLLLFLGQNDLQEEAASMTKVISSLQCVQLKRSMTKKQSSILQYFNSELLP